jgi:hypothetical protein
MPSKLVTIVQLTQLPITGRDPRSPKCRVLSAECTVWFILSHYHIYLIHCGTMRYNFDKSTLTLQHNFFL